MFCRMARAADNDTYAKEFDIMSRYAPEMVSRKIFSSLHQSAQMLYFILYNIRHDDKLLSAGSFEDVPTEVLLKQGFDVVGVDPVLNTDLHTYKLRHPEEKFDIIFSTSVIEHVEDDEQFIEDICDMLKPGGLCFITCDFKPGYVTGDPLPATCVRLYTKERLMKLTRLLVSRGCELTEDPSWDVTPEELDFEWDGVRYCFMGMSFRKV